MNLIAFSAIAKHSVTDIFLVNPNDAIKMMDADNDGYNSDEDCNDNDPLTYPGAAYNESDTECMTDSDGDGYGDVFAVSPIIPGTDCEDSNPGNNPGGTEILNGFDDNCNGQIDEGLCGNFIVEAGEACDDGGSNDPANSCYNCQFVNDADGDGFNSAFDCNDDDININPNATEIPNNDVDEDCNGLAEVYDLALTTTTNSPINNSIGDIIKFTFTIANEGNTNVDNIVLQVTNPSGFTPVDMDNTPLGWDNVASSFTVISELSPSSNISIDYYIQLEVGSSEEDFTIIGEITSFEDLQGNLLVDFDSEPNNSEASEDDQDEAFAFPCGSDCLLTCRNNVNVSVDELNCMIEITPSSISEDIDTDCDFYYTITLFDEDGLELPTNVIDASMVGMLITYELSEPECNNKCSGTALIEDKMAPTLSAQDFTVSCVTLNEQGTAAMLLPTVSDNCQNTLPVELLSEVEINVDCNNPDSDDLIGYIERTYIVQDAEGNISDPVTQTITLERVTIGAIARPTDFIFPLDTISCSSGYATDEFGNPDVSVTGVPTTIQENYDQASAIFDYIDISVPGNLILIGDDESVDVDLGASFPLFDMTFNVISVNTNGFISTASGDAVPNSECPLSLDPNSLANTNGARIYALQDDLSADTTEDVLAGVYYEYMTESPVLTPSGMLTGVSIFQWKVDHFEASGDYDLDFQALLFDNGEITFQYNEIGEEMGSEATVGIQSFAMDDNTMPLHATTISCNTPNSVSSLSAVGLIPPTMGGIDLYPFPEGVSCNGYSQYNDQIVYTDSCMTKILRTFTIGEWRCNDTNERYFNQMIDIMDVEGPTMDQLPDITVSTEPFSCEANVLLPAISPDDDCNKADIVIDIEYEVGSRIENAIEDVIVEMPLGIYTVTYIATDKCGNESRMSFTVTVIDAVVPTAICNADQISVGNDPSFFTAVALDNGSFDDCGPVTLAIARTDDPGYPDLAIFTDELEFGCIDIGNTYEVALLVTDTANNTSICTSNLLIEDGIAPFFADIPEDITIDCTEDIDTYPFDNPTVVDNCDLPDAFTVSLDTIDINLCGESMIERVFTINDSDISDVQLIQINFVNQLAVTGTIDDSTVEGCDASDAPAQTTVSGLVELDGDLLITDACVELTVTSTDETAGICPLVITRTYVVQDACGNTTADIVHTIIVEDTTAPVVTGSITDSAVEGCDASAAPSAVTTVSAMEDLGDLMIADACTADEDLTVTSSDDSAGTCPLVITRTYVVQDACGNTTAGVVHTITVDDTVAPIFTNPPTSISVQIEANETVADLDIIAEVDETCIFSTSYVIVYDDESEFEGDGSDASGEYPVGEHEVTFTATDDCGNSATLIVMVTVNTPSNIATIEGSIYTESFEEVNSVQIGLTGIDAFYQTTEENGEYAFSDIPMGHDYMVYPYKNDNHKNGLTTLDLVLIQRHILGLGDLESPYKMIAADINNSQSISSVDLVILRKIILGIYDDFPNNRSWRFIDAQYNFLDATDPWLGSVPEDYEITHLDSDMKIDFIGVKTGDVNGSAIANIQSKSSETRSDNKWLLSICDKFVKKDENVVLEVKAENISKVYGWQYTLESKDLSFIAIESASANLSNQNIRRENSNLHMSYGHAVGLELEPNDIIYTMIFKATRSGKLSDMLNISNRGLTAESYHKDLEINNVEIRWNESVEESDLTQGFSVAQNEPNPWNERTSVDYYIPTAGDVKIVIKDVRGRVLFKSASYKESGNHTQDIEDSFLDGNGVLVYEVHYSGKLISNRMIHIR
jgi:uncharacterized repeat protein (TIGR01451 family)